ncbi:sulfatase-like hydrolase/transferase [Pinibacter aurantiacus]|uniref:Sulfatase-like hydrolase/transferase n=1 Tax=Pinibacter aurantiacus TaxID=2851599 RepID=A0A9E2W5W7_9BACT|nr:sulfatase-like hydrolase/transferase [Pinibacter aurantiacus]MBV4359118.1 sulfatase-like hydrolase/transferase [Pinibacter aurantiacus]
MLLRAITIFFLVFSINAHVLQAQQKPNIVFILADDLGYHDIGTYGNKVVPTPHIDSLALSGVKMLNGYCTSPICSPSRAAILTGRYQQRFGFEFQEKDAPIGKLSLMQKKKFYRRAHKEGDIIDLSKDSIVVPNGLPKDEITLAQVLKQNGYKTGAIGKWNLGVADYQLPGAKGFDYFYGFYAAAGLYASEKDPTIVNQHIDDILDRPTWFRHKYSALVRNGEAVDETEYLTNKFGEEAVAFIEQNKSSPFFLYVPFNAPHTPFQAPKDIVARFSNVAEPQKQVYYAMITALDDAIGKIIGKLKETGLDKNTLIIFTSDNGGATYTTATDNEPLKGGKMCEFDGGIKVPYIMSYADKIPAGATYQSPVSTLDIFSTAVGVAGIAAPAGKVYDGVNLLPFVSGENSNAPHDILYWRNGYSKAIRKGEYKLYINEKEKVEFLYDLSKDPGERNDVSTNFPEKAKELKADLNRWEETLGKPMWKSRFHFRLKVRDRYFIFPT